MTLPAQDPQVLAIPLTPVPEAAPVSVEHSADAHWAQGNLASVSLALIAVLASLSALRWAAEVVVPVLLGLTLSCALTPVVNQLTRFRIPRALAAAALLASVVGGMASIIYTLSDEAVAMVQALPAAAQKVGRSLQGPRNQGPAAAIDKVQQAVTEIERAAQAGTAATAAPGRGVAKVQIERPKFNVKDYLWPGALGLAAAFAQALVVLFIAFFLLAMGNAFRRKLVKFAGPDFSHKKITLQAIDEINGQIQIYLLVQVSTSLLVGVATWLAFSWIGVDNAAVWGVAAFVLNFIPYFGGLIVTGSSALLGFVQFGSFEMAVLVGAVALLITSIEGYFLTPWLAGRAGRMNPLAVFVGVLAWGWLWGAWGLFLGVPILMAIKAVCDRVEGLALVGELLGE